MEACATANYWARELSRLGHDVRLIPPAYVKAYVRRQKNDRADAAAICEAVSRPSMRFATLKTTTQQVVQVLHRTRELLIKQRVQLGNALRAHLAEFGHIFPQGAAGLDKTLGFVTENAGDLPEELMGILRVYVEQITRLRETLKGLERDMLLWHRSQQDSLRLATIPGIGTVTASAIVAAIGDGQQFHSGREFAAWIGLVPRQNSSGGKERLGRISKQGNAYLRQLLVTSATNYLRGERHARAVGGTWFSQLLKRKPGRLATVALANKMARVAWAVLTKGETYHAMPA
jgi:transposase